MPPKLRNVCTASQWSQSASRSVSLFLLPFLCTQHRYASVLSGLSDNQSAYNKKIRRGRGPSSGKGKTSGRGHKGQKQHGKVPAGFNGGQTPDEVVHGIRGFTNVFSKDMVPLNLDKIQSWVDQGRLDPTKPVTIKELAASRCASDIKDGIKLLAGGSERISHPLNIIVSRASAAAIAAVEAAGGSVTTRYYTPFSIRGIIKGNIDPIHSLSSRIDAGEGTEERRVFKNRLPDPTSRKEIEYYRDPAKRGYLSYQVGEGQGPSLFFRTPSTAISVKKRVQSKVALGAENRMW